MFAFKAADRVCRNFQEVFAKLIYSEGGGLACKKTLAMGDAKKQEPPQAGSSCFFAFFQYKLDKNLTISASLETKKPPQLPR